MLESLIDNYFNLTLEYRKAVARRQTLHLQNKNTGSVELARNREKDIGKTLLTLRKRIVTEKDKQKTKFNNKIVNALACIIVEVYFEPKNFIKELIEISDEELFSMINATDDTLTVLQINKVIKKLRVFCK